MKCRACWSDKAYVRPVKGWRRGMLAALLLVPLKCHHCYHKFSVPWLLTWGKQLTPPALRVAPDTVGAQTSGCRRHASGFDSALHEGESARKAA